jgi:membrane protein YqaA with SNARE-associated domain
MVLLVAGRPERERSAALLNECRRAFDGFETFASSRAAIALMFVWAFAEAIVWPVIPDFLLVPLMAANRRHPVALLLAAIAGMATGGIATFMFASVAPNAARDVLVHLPMVSDSDIAEAARRLREDGASAFLLQPWSGIAFKVWGVQAGVMDMSPFKAVPAFVAARAARMTIFASVAWLAGARLRGFLRDFSIYVAIAYLAIFFYGWWQVSG